MDQNPPVERRLSADVRMERYGAIAFDLLLVGWGIHMAWRSFREDGLFQGGGSFTAWMCLPGIVYLFFLHQTRQLHDVSVSGDALRIVGPRVNATVPLALVRYVELLPIGRGRRRIVLTFDRSAGLGDAIEFIPVGVPLFGGGEEIAKELTQLVKDAHGPT